MRNFRKAKTQINKMNPKNRIKVMLVIALWMACLFDIVTFFMLKKQQFEINPVYLLTGSVFFIILFKLATNAGLSWLLFNPSKRKDGSPNHKWAYLIVLCVLYGFILQSLGGYSNMATSGEYEATVGTPQEIQPMQPVEAAKTYGSIVSILYVLPVLLAFFSFYLWEKMYLIED